MKNSTGTEQGALGFLVGACYLISLALCGAALYALAQLLPAAGGAASGMYRAGGLF